MTIRTIVTVPEAVLRRKARPVTKFDESLQTLIDDMVETMRAAPGVGLAAPQVAVSQQVIVVEYPLNDEDEEAKPKLFVVINPQIVKSSPETVNGIEGCLSVPELVGEVERAEEITVKGQNRRGQPLRIKAKGWLARIFQHEIDHLNGVLFTDRATRIWKPEGPAEDNV
ncbi:MAG: peptide deformylase [Candidatus Villigracilaceae bacterium]